MFFKNLLKGLILSLIIAAVLIFVFSYICYSQDDPRALMGILGKIALAASSLAGGFVAAKGNKANGVLSGLASGGLYAVVLFVLSFALNGGKTKLYSSLILLAVVPLLSALGGYIATASGKKRKRRTYKRKRL